MDVPDAQPEEGAQQALAQLAQQAQVAERPRRKRKASAVLLAGGEYVQVCDPGSPFLTGRPSFAGWGAWLGRAGRLVPLPRHRDRYQWQRQRLGVGVSVFCALSNPRGSCARSAGRRVPPAACGCLL